MSVKTNKIVVFFVLSAIAVGILIHYYEEGRERAEFRGALQGLIYLDDAKQRGAINLGLSNGYPITIQQTEVNDPLNPPDGLKLSKDGRSIESARGWAYILGPVGTPVKVRLYRQFAGHPAGAEFTAPIAVVPSRKK